MYMCFGSWGGGSLPINLWHVARFGPGLLLVCYLVKVEISFGLKYFVTYGVPRIPSASHLVSTKTLPQPPALLIQAA